MVFADFPICRLVDQQITLGLSPPIPISGLAIEFQAMKRFGATNGVFLKSVASGFNNVSGINVFNAPQAQMNIQINSVDTSGLDFGAYPYEARRVDSGFRTVVAQGYLLLNPSGG